ncbi:hypothetical protein LIER_17406 [Lithospermum erythrorhizon]|uniref:Uncharacterized protein n=1 Tax=Lithospermum erythrorhizon TaxID=34254 RepID=A0AAV3QA94_LITER
MGLVRVTQTGLIVCFLLRVLDLFLWDRVRERAPILSSATVPSSSKPFKKRSLPEDDSVDRDPKHANWGSCRRPGHVAGSSPDVLATVTKHVETTLVLVLILPKIVPSSGVEAQTEVVDSEEPLDCIITAVDDIEASKDEAQTEVVDIKEPSDHLIMKVADAEIHVAPLPTRVQHIESILRDSLKVAWMRLCSFVEGKSPETLLVEEEGIMASFDALTSDARYGVIAHKVHDKVMAIRASSPPSSFKLQHETKAISSVLTTL